MNIFLKAGSQKYICTHTFTAALLTIPKVEATPGSINEWTDKKCGPSIEWNSFQPQKGRKFWHIYNMDKSMLSKMSQSQKDKPSMFLLVWFKETESWMIWKVEWQFPSAGSGRNRELVSNGDRISFLQDERVVLISCMTMWIHLTLLNQIAPLGPPAPTQPPLLGCGVAPLEQELCWSSHEEIPHVQGKRNPSKTVGVVRGHQRADTLKP